MQCTRMVIVVLTAACLLRPLPPAVTPRGAAQAGQVTWRCVTNRRKSLSSCRRGASLCSCDLRLLVPVGPMGQGAGCCWVALDVASPVELPEEHLEQHWLLSVVLVQECVDVPNVGRAVLHEQGHEAAPNGMPRTRSSCR